MIRMHRLLTVVKFNSKSCSFAANLSTKTPNIQKLKESKEFPAKQIDYAVEKTPELRQYTRDQWLRTFETLTGQGVNASSFMRIIVKRPQLLRRSSDKLFESIECLRESQFGDENIVELVERHPELLEFNNSTQLRKKMAFLQSFANTQKNIFRLFLASPNVLTESDETTTTKIDYLTNVMKVDETDASKSSVLAYSLAEIKCRHVFLSRLGLFKPKNPKVNRLQPSKNPKMSAIFDRSDRDFAVLTCGVTLEEFVTFRELYKREKSRYEDDSDEE